jgi:hypothetical protein
MARVKRSCAVPWLVTRPPSPGPDGKAESIGPGGDPNASDPEQPPRYSDHNREEPDDGNDVCRSGAMKRHETPPLEVGTGVSESIVCNADSASLARGKPWSLGLSCAEGANAEASRGVGRAE